MQTKLKVGMVFRTNADVDLTVTDLDGSPRYERLPFGNEFYFRDYSKTYEEGFWNVNLIRQEFELDCKRFVRENPHNHFIANINIILFDEDGNILKCIKLDYQ